MILEKVTETGSREYPLSDSIEKIRETHALHSLTLLHKRNRELYDLRQRIDRYLHINSHDLRGPVVQILGLVDLLNHSAAVNDDTRDLLGSLQHAAQGLDRTVRDLNELLISE